MGDHLARPRLARRLSSQAQPTFGTHRYQAGVGGLSLSGATQVGSGMTFACLRPHMLGRTSPGHGKGSMEITTAGLDGTALAAAPAGAQRERAKVREVYETSAAEYDDRIPGPGIADQTFTDAEAAVLLGKVYAHRRRGAGGRQPHLGVCRSPGREYSVRWWRRTTASTVPVPRSSPPFPGRAARLAEGQRDCRLPRSTRQCQARLPGRCRNHHTTQVRGSQGGRGGHRPTSAARARRGTRGCGHRQRRAMSRLPI